MSGPPNFPLLSQASDEALKDLFEFKRQNALHVTARIPSHSPSPPPSQPLLCLPPADSYPSRPRPPKTPAYFKIYPNAAHGPNYRDCELQRQRDNGYMYPPTSHMPTLMSQPTSWFQYMPRIYPEPLTCITSNMVFDRVYLLLLENLTKRGTNNPHPLIYISNGTTDRIIRSGHKCAFGPDGLSSLTDIFVCIGHKGKQHYMCLAARGSGVVHEFLTGRLCEDKGKDPTRDGGMMQQCREGFDDAAMKIHMGNSAQSVRDQLR